MGFGSQHFHMQTVNKTSMQWLNVPETAEGEGHEAFYFNESFWRLHNLLDLRLKNMHSAGALSLRQTDIYESDHTIMLIERLYCSINTFPSTWLLRHGGTHLVHASV